MSLEYPVLPDNKEALKNDGNMSEEYRNQHQWLNLGQSDYQNNADGKEIHETNIIKEERMPTLTAE